MYERYYGLQERPFELTPNPRFLYMTPAHREALTTLEYGLSARTGIALLLGEAGTGKTTIVHAALQSQRARQSLTVYLNNPSLTREEFVDFLATAFGLSAQAAQLKTRCITELTDLLASRHSVGNATKRKCCLTRCSKKCACWPTSNPRQRNCCRSS
jgi:general secretion pathway protein A